MLCSDTLQRASQRGVPRLVALSWAMEYKSVDDKTCLFSVIRSSLGVHISALQLVGSDNVTAFESPWGLRTSSMAPKMTPTNVNAMAMPMPNANECFIMPPNVIGSCGGANGELWLYSAGTCEYSCCSTNALLSASGFGSTRRRASLFFTLTAFGRRIVGSEENARVSTARMVALGTRCAAPTSSVERVVIARRSGVMKLCISRVCLSWSGPLQRQSESPMASWLTSVIDTDRVVITTNTLPVKMRSSLAKQGEISERIPWHDQCPATIMVGTPWAMRVSPVTRVVFRGQRVHVKRDDVFHLAGNKMRKLYWFLQQRGSFFDGAHMISFGGTQSNAMLAIAQVANAKCVPFTYFSRKLELKASHSHPSDAADNLSVAKALGMRHIELSVEEYRHLAESKDLAEVAKAHIGDAGAWQPLLIPQGAAFKNAEDGLRVLAEELNDYCTKGDSPEELCREFSVVVPCGTGTTAFYLAQHLHPSIRLLAVPCVGDSVYLQDQFQALAAQHASSEAMKTPEMLVPSRKARFGRLSTDLLGMYHELRDSTGIDFDLLYATFAWQTLFEPENLAKALDASSSIDARELLYVHTGGVSGNGSMLARYQQKLS